jgi:phosphotransferase system HPr-like phosphotransfer protein
MDTISEQDTESEVDAPQTNKQSLDLNSMIGLVLQGVMPGVNVPGMSIPTPSEMHTRPSSSIEEMNSKTSSIEEMTDEIKEEIAEIK